MYRACVLFQLIVPILEKCWEMTYFVVYLKEV